MLPFVRAFVERTRLGIILKYAYILRIKLKTLNIVYLTLVL